MFSKKPPEDTNTATTTTQEDEVFYCSNPFAILRQMGIQIDRELPAHDFEGDSCVLQRYELKPVPVQLVYDSDAKNPPVMASITVVTEEHFKAYKLVLPNGKFIKVWKKVARKTE